MKKYPAQSMVEYGIIACLVAVVALPALVLLSDNTNALLGNLLQGEPPDPRANQRAAASNNLQAAGPNNLQASAGAPIEQFVVQSGKAVYDPATGTYTFPVLEANGTGTSTASVSGTRRAIDAMAAQLEKLSDAYAKAHPGQSLPPAVVTALNDLSNRAEGISQVILNDRDEDRLVAHGGGFNNSFRDFQALMSQPEYQELDAHISPLVEAYSGIVSRAATDEMKVIMRETGYGIDDNSRNYVGSYHQFETIKDIAVVPSTEVLTTQERGVLTHQQAENIGGLAHPAGGSNTAMGGSNVTAGGSNNAMGGFSPMAGGSNTSPTSVGGSGPTVGSTIDSVGGSGQSAGRLDRSVDLHAQPMYQTAEPL